MTGSCRFSLTIKRLRIGSREAFYRGGVNQRVASFANNALRKSGGHRTEAVETWSEDVAWLRKTFYEEHFGFPWPDIGLHKT